MEVAPTATRVLAIDWSGALVGAETKIWLAEVASGRLVRLEGGRDRDAIAEHLVAEAERDPRMVVGLDFAFSLPAWFLEERSLRSAHELWALADREADGWLAACEPPFWGRGPRPRPAMPEDRHFRRAETALRQRRIWPKSVFQIGGAGAVGTGSLRGMRLLHRLHEAGFSIWPFDPPGWPLVVEIYPRLLTGPVNKSSDSARASYLAAHYPNLGTDLTVLAASSDDAFDAAVSALLMARHLDELQVLPPAEDRQTRLEGAIWEPGRPLQTATGLAEL